MSLKQQECTAEPGCPNPGYYHAQDGSEGVWCRTHYTRWYRNGTLERQRQENAGHQCAVIENDVRCPEPAEKRGWCRNHYGHYQRWNNPLYTQPQTIECPHCGEPMRGFAEVCGHCKRRMVGVSYQGAREGVWTRNSIIEWFKQLVADLGYVPLRKDICKVEFGHPSKNTIDYHLGSYTKLVVAAGFQPVIHPRNLGHLPAHGTLARYKHRHDPCHCIECRAANTKAIRERRARNAKTMLN